MSAHKKPYDEENETEEAWFWVVVSHMGGRKSDLKEIARLLRSDEPVPKIAKNFIADLIDPPRGGGEDVKLVLKRNDREGKLKKALTEYQEALAIVAAMKRGKSVTQAIAEVMPGRRRQGFRLLESEWIEVLKRYPELFEPAIQPPVGDKK